MGLQIRAFMEAMDSFTVANERFRFAKHYLKKAGIPFEELDSSSIVVHFKRLDAIVTNDSMIIQWKKLQPQNSK